MCEEVEMERLYLGKKDYKMIRKLEGLTAKDLIEILENYPKNAKVCTEMLGECFPIKQVEQCIYYDFEKGKKIREHKGVLVK
jgi:hypothetical protein